MDARHLDHKAVAAIEHDLVTGLQPAIAHLHAIDPATLFRPQIAHQHAVAVTLQACVLCSEGRIVDEDVRCRVAADQTRAVQSEAAPVMTTAQPT
ncbi:hypothetical protein XVE_1652 [Xanthomonas vesicatoria ATCC 35937]|uniref:Uncharacterized protein n=1 Tax=Xanthomonas vesicatoria ATCC 35937 TaxID=925775 RepID=F0BC28_9XANT|nr:hypothetical protein XVE_1652 [Xanthomonas vesicatoria ATCC 35937]